MIVNFMQLWWPVRTPTANTRRACSVSRSVVAALCPPITSKRAAPAIPTKPMQRKRGAAVGGMWGQTWTAEFDVRGVHVVHRPAPQE